MEDSTSMYKVNDFVWAKMARYPPWPALVMKPDPSAPPKPKKSQWIYFFGSHDYAWVEERHIKPFDAFKEQYKATYKQPAIQEAVEELEEIIEEKTSNPDYQIEIIKYTRKDKRKKGRTSSVSSSDSRKRSSSKETNKSVRRKRSRSSLSDTDRGSPLTDNHYEYPRTQNPEVISPKTFGFIALNIYAEGIIKNLILSKHRMHVYSTSSAMCEELQDYADEQGVYFRIFNSPREVVKNSDIIFSFLTDPEHPREILEELGVLDENDSLLDGKGYVEMTSVEPEFSIEMCTLVENKGGTYIEAMVQGNLLEASTGELVVFAAGKVPPFNECQSCFKSMGKAAFLLETVGSASKIHMLLQTMRGVFLAGLAECYAMADKCGILQKTFHTLFCISPMSSSYLRGKGSIIVNESYSDTVEPVQKIHEALSQIRRMSNQLRQPMPLASNANEIFKHARRLGYDNQDSACVYNRTRY